MAGCYIGNANGPRVEIIGDSITFLASARIASTLEPAHSIEVNVVPGVTIAGQLGGMSSAAAEQPPPTDWIVNLGTNDPLDNDTAWRSGSDQMLAVTSSARCVVLVTNNTTADTLKGHPDAHVATEENALIRTLARSYPNHYLWIDWNGLVQTHPRWLQADTVHPRILGQRKLAKWYGLALSTCP